MPGFLRKEHSVSLRHLIAKNQMPFHHPVRNGSIDNVPGIHYGDVSIKNGHRQSWSPFADDKKTEKTRLKPHSSRHAA